MAFVKLDTGILDSTLWVERECREVFITALLLAEPFELEQNSPQFEIRTLAKTGFEVPPGWYGMVRAAGVGILRRAMVEHEVGMAALEKLGAADPESRSSDFEGRRLVRVDGGFIVLNFMKYRDRDHTAAERAKRYRERKISRRDYVPSHRDITQADADAEADSEAKRGGAARASRLTQDWQPDEKLKAWAVVERPDLEIIKTIEKFRDYWTAKPGKDGTKLDWAATFRNWVRTEKANNSKPPAPSSTPTPPCAHCKQPIIGGFTIMDKGKVCRACRKAYTEGKWV